jgi:hypothetical protein
LNRDEKALARVIFMNKVFSSSGQAYEDLFCNILSKACPDFIPIKPQGSFGDRKNDGYHKKIGRYYQVYAPEEPKENEAQAIQKAERDFRGLLAYWQSIHPIREYFFVFNDKYRGSFPTIEKTLESIKTAYNLDDTGVFLAKHLEDVLFSLDDDAIQSIIGFIPNPDHIEMIDYLSLREVINYFQKNRKPLTAVPPLVVPEFDEKIIFNGLSSHIKNLLNNANYQIGLLDEYFYKNGAAIKQELRDRLSAKYRNANKLDFGNLPEGVSRGDLVFFEIFNSLVPPDCRSQSIEEATLVLMAKYFESCDIFEEPNRN